MSPPRSLKHQPPTIVAGISIAKRRPSRPSRDVTLILGAIPQESELVELAMTGKKPGKLSGFPYVTGRLHGRKVVLAVTGIGKTCATMLTTLYDDGALTTALRRRRSDDDDDSLGRR